MCFFADCSGGDQFSWSFLWLTLALKWRFFVSTYQSWYLSLALIPNKCVTSNAFSIIMASGSCQLCSLVIMCQPQRFLILLLVLAFNLCIMFCYWSCYWGKIFAMPAYGSGMSVFFAGLGFVRIKVNPFKYNRQKKLSHACQILSLCLYYCYYFPNEPVKIANRRSVPKSFLTPSTSFNRCFI